MGAPLDVAPAHLFDVAARLSEDHVSMGKRANVRMARDVARESLGANGVSDAFS